MRKYKARTFPLQMHWLFPNGGKGSRSEAWLSFISSNTGSPTYRVASPERKTYNGDIFLAIIGSSRAFSLR
jgi:hypothetical protein